MLSSFNEILFSSSPLVFGDMEKLLEDIYKEKEKEEEKDLLITLKYNLVIKDIIIFGLNKKINKYKLGYQVHKALLNGEPSFIKIK